MMELQGAVGLAQLKKLPEIVNAQRENYDLLAQVIGEFPGVELRESPIGSYGTADALVFLVASQQLALRCREQLLEQGLTTKILPEAYTWHFAGCWDHMPELLISHDGNLSQAFPKSQEILSRAVSIPVGVRMAANVAGRVRDALMKALLA